MEKDKQNRHDRPQAYPLPTEADKQMANQPEFTDQQPNDFRDKSISDLPANEARERESNDPQSDTVPQNETR
jgi:hypothetical protein